MEDSVGIVVEGKTIKTTNDLHHAKALALQYVKLGKDCYIDLYRPLTQKGMNKLRWDAESGQWISNALP